MLRLEARQEPSLIWRYASPLLALAITCALGTALFIGMGISPTKGLSMFFWEPIKSVYALSELLVKATPLLLIALGLSVCFKSNIWNIGAEGQFVMGAVFAAGVALVAQADSHSGYWLWVVLAGILGGMLWAGITAFLRDTFHANEILVSLMLVYVSVMILNYLVYGSWKDPLGYNFPQTKTFEADTQIPKLITGTRVNIGALVALVGAGVLWLFMFRTHAGFALQVGGLAPDAARYAGFSSRRALWTALLILLYGTAFTIMFTVLPRLGAVGNTSIMNVEPVCALILAWLILDQHISFMQIIGALIVVSGAILLGLRKN